MSFGGGGCWGTSVRWVSNKITPRIWPLDILHLFILIKFKRLARVLASKMASTWWLFYTTFTTNSRRSTYSIWRKLLTPIIVTRSVLKWRTACTWLLLRGDKSCFYALVYWLAIHLYLLGGRGDLRSNILVSTDDAEHSTRCSKGSGAMIPRNYAIDRTPK